MSSKIRVHDLAKKYGMSGKDLAAKLRDLGFTQVKTHMTALTEFEAMEVQGRLEAYGIVAETKEDEGEQLGGGLVVRRKKKKKAPADQQPPPPTKPAVADAAVPEPEPEPVAPAEEPAIEPAPAPSAELEPATEAPAPTAGEETRVPSVPVTAEPSPEAVRAEQPTAPVHAEPEAAELVEPTPRETAEQVSEAPAASPAAELVETEAAAEESSSDAEAAEASTDAPTDEPAKSGEIKAAGKAKSQVVRPGSQRRMGRVVGFIDLSQIKTTPPPKRPQSRRLRSTDEVAPDVQPTMGRDRKSALQRGAHSNRGNLTAGQLREREAGRFLRRSRPAQAGGNAGGGGGGRRGQQGGMRRDNTIGSPFAGGMVKVDEPVTIRELAESLSVKGNQLLSTSFKLLGFGAVTLNSTIDNETAQLLANEFDVELEIVRAVEAEEALLEGLSKQRSEIEDEHLELRSPTIAFLGHVDHGKTTLIDTIRKSQVTQSEAGGITQHIGAYQVSTKQGHSLTVVDTPGHEAFSAMRARGAQAVDVVVLVVAADDGVMPQTEEAINHARAAKVPIVVALNKSDKPDSNPERVKQQLSGLELVPEEWGGSTAMIEVSGLKGTGVDELLERVFLEGELLELKSHPEGPATGIVLEAEKQEGKGILAHLLVLDGTLNRGDVILAGDGYGKVRSLTNDRGVEVETAGPSMPVEVSGLSELPGVGEHFHVVSDLSTAKEVASERAHKNRMVSLAERSKTRSGDILEAVAEQEKEVINLIIRADVIGTLQALREQIGRLIHDEMELRVIHSAVGNVSESDVNLAIPANALILTFHVGISTNAKKAADRAGLTIRNFTVIYELLDFIRSVMEGSLAPEIQERVTGHVEIRRIFESSRFGKIAGCYVLDGKVTRDDRLRLTRDDVVLHSGRVGSLRRVSDDVKEVREGFECGIVIKDHNDIREGDVLETYKLIEVKRELGI